MFYLILSNVNKLFYVRDVDKSRLKKLNGFNLSMEFPNGFPEKAPKEGEITKIDFFMGRESRETFPVRDNKGNFDSLDLPDDKNLCFKTHGSFIFKEREGQ
jgi:hypothetical protein